MDEGKWFGVVALSWSSGKDSALALAQMRGQGRPPELLLTTVDERSGRAAHHGVPRELLRAQAEAVALPLLEIEIPSAADADTYGERMREAFSRPPLEDVEAVAFGDLFLEDLRAFREERLGSIGVRAEFPLWGRDTTELAQQLVAEDYEAIIVSVDPAAAEAEWLGRRLDSDFLAGLPTSVDPCGERGEFHTFVRFCPEFSDPIALQRGEKLERDGFPFLELLPA